jgi:hypothetical protein
MRLLPLLCCLSLLAGCAATTEVVATRDATPAAAAAPAELLVVAVSADDTLRRRYELAFMKQLRRSGITAHGSHEYLPALAGMTMRDLHVAMREQAPAFARVLHLQLADLVPQRFLGPDDYAGEITPAHGKVGTLDVTLNAPPGDGGAVPPVQYLVDLQATLYDGPSRQLLWSGTTRTREANSLDAVARSQARALLDEFTERGYVRGKR